MTMWGGRFEKDTDSEIKRFSDSLAVDQRLLEADIKVSCAWAEGLSEIAVLSSGEKDEILQGLEAIRKRVAQQPSWVSCSSAEDIHSFVEEALVELVGDPAKKLHAGRSRNDQVTTDLRIWLRGAIGDLDLGIHKVQKSFLNLGEKNKKVMFPGFTHLQCAQPLLFAHWCHSYIEKLDRDRARLTDAASRADRCSLGSGALAGSSYPIDRGRLARRLGFSCATVNSLDAVSDRDYVVETLAACAITMTHLSNLAEDLIFYASSESGFMTLGEEVSTGSSMMPQKKNPDPLELIRGKCGRTYGHLVGFLTTLKGLPLAYNKDLQEDKEALFGAIDTLQASLGVAAKVLGNLTVNVDRARAAAEAGFSTATGLADYLVRKGIPFRTAHKLVGQVVRRCMEKGTEFTKLPLPDYQKISRDFDEGLYQALELESSIALYDVEGGTAPKRVSEALEKVNSVP